MPPLDTSESKTLIDVLLQEQRTMTAVDRFAQKHESATLPLQERYYRDLLPLNEPEPGEQYAFEVNLDQCTGCKACVAACHSLNGLEDEESWRAVGLLVSDETAAPFQQTVTTACHHCIDPGCLHGCPVLAYEKDAATGIVRHLDDQCIGCQYCILKCPYEVPRYSKRLGIVRKCDMCTGRLAVGEAPACVQSCPNEAISIKVVNKIDVAREHIAGGAFLPSSPDPRHTIPSTRYVSTRTLPENLSAADAVALKPADAHWPLVVMLVLTQASIGGMCAAAAGALAGQRFPVLFLVLMGGMGFAGIGASILHLGRPLHAWRAILGVRRSWLSREIIAFSLFAKSVLLLLAAEAWPLFWLQTPALLLTAVAGIGALGASVMVYADTPREFWSWRRTAPRFAGTAVLLGSAASLLFVESSAASRVVAVCSLVKLGLELSTFLRLGGQSEALRRTALLQSQALLKISIFRFASLAGGGLVLPLLALFSDVKGFGIAAGMFLVLLASELAERTLFFRSVAQPKMPGGLA